MVVVVYTTFATFVEPLRPVVAVCASAPGVGDPKQNKTGATERLRRGVAVCAGLERRQ
jgi:hypothetical protein